MDIVDELKQALLNGKTLNIKIKVNAGAKKNLIEQTGDGQIKIKINKPAVDGKANKGIIEFLSEILNVPKSNIIILRGEKTSVKDLRIIPKRTIM